MQRCRRYKIRSGCISPNARDFFFAKGSLHTAANGSSQTSLCKRKVNAHLQTTAHLHYGELIKNVLHLEEFSEILASHEAVVILVVILVLRSHDLVQIQEVPLKEKDEIFHTMYDEISTVEPRNNGF